MKYRTRQVLGISFGVLLIVFGGYITQYKVSCMGSMLNYFASQMLSALIPTVITGLISKDKRVGILMGLSSGLLILPIILVSFASNTYAEFTQNLPLAYSFWYVQWTMIAIVSGIGGFLSALTTAWIIPAGKRQVRFKIVNLPVNQAYMHLLEFLKSSELMNVYGGRWYGFNVIKVVDSKEPVYAKVKMGLTTKLSPMAVNINLTSQDGESKIRFNFDLSNLILFYVLIFISFFLFSWINLSGLRFESTAVLLGFVLFPFFFFLPLAFIGYRYYSTVQVQRFMGSFDYFFLRLGAKVEVEKE